MRLFKNKRFISPEHGVISVLRYGIRDYWVVGLGERRSVKQSCAWAAGVITKRWMIEQKGLLARRDEKFVKRDFYLIGLGGKLAGISLGQDILASLAFRPASAEAMLALISFNGSLFAA